MEGRVPHIDLLDPGEIVNVKEFTEEQFRVIGLQMGSNEGESQAGQNFGKRRNIID